MNFADQAVLSNPRMIWVDVSGRMVCLTWQAEPPSTRDVNRDSGTVSANGGWFRRLVRRTAACQAISQVTKHNRYNRPNAKKRLRSDWQPKHPPSIFCLSAKPASAKSQLPLDQVLAAADVERRKAAANKSSPAALDKDHKPRLLRHPQKSPLDIRQKASHASAAQALARSSDSRVPRLESTGDLVRRAADNHPVLRVGISS